MPTRSGRRYKPYQGRRRSVYPPGGLWGYEDHDTAHRHRPEDDEDKTEFVRSYRRRPRP